MRLCYVLCLVLCAIVQGKVVRITDYFNQSSTSAIAHAGNRSNHINPTHYGSPLDCSSCSPPINCRLDEDGLIIDSFVWNPITGKMTQALFMWCAPNLTKSIPPRTTCPIDMPANATTVGAKPMRMDPHGDCFLSCMRDSDCGGGAVCANETGSLPGSHFMCAWPLQ